MAWIESHQELREHPKTKRLCRILGLPRPAAVGYLHFLWWWAYDYAPEGDLSSFTDEDIADAIDWEMDPSILVSGLVQAGFLTEDRRLHDWEDFAQKWIERRRADRERKRATRTSPPDVHRTAAGQAAEVHSLSGVTGPDHTGPNRTGPDHTEPELLPLDGIEGGAGGSGAAAAANGAAAPPPTEGNGKASKRSRNRTRVPDDFELTERHYEYAAGLGIDAATAESETEKFLAHHRFKATLGVDWYAGWQNWLRESIGRFAPRGSPAARARAPTPRDTSRIPSDASRYFETRTGSLRSR